MSLGIELGTSRTEDRALTLDCAILAPRADVVVLALPRGSNPGPPVLPGAHSLKYNFYQIFKSKSRE